jgi:hypothetical protein
MFSRSLRRRCAAIARTLSVPEPFELDAFLDALARTRGRPIRLVSVELPAGAPCGLCVSTDAADYIAVTSSAGGSQRDHIALHEVAHLLLDHQVRMELFQHLDPGTVRAVHARTCYDTLAEREAETLASLIGQRARRPHPSGPDADPLLERLGRSLEHPSRYQGEGS